MKNIFYQNQFLNWEKVFKTAKIQFHENFFFDLFDFTIFFCLDFFRFSGTLWVPETQYTKPGIQNPE